MPQTVPAADLPVALFRQIYHWPLIAKVDKPWLDTAWKEVKDPLALLVDAQDEKSVETQRTWAVQEFNYFHDTIQRFLYGEDRAFTLYRRSDLDKMTVTVGSVGHRRTHHFTIDRLTLHVFDAEPRVAIVTLEIAWEQVEDGRPLTLADVQTLIDHTRRSYAPFWFDAIPARCPRDVTLIDSDGKEVSYGIATARETHPRMAFATIAHDRDNDAPIFPHWRSIAGLRLNDGTSDYPCEWRDPSDERIPAMSFIALEPANEGSSARDTMQLIKRSDWLRIADAEEAGAGWPYNRRFLQDTENSAYYDRFYPDDHQDENVATRHVFGGAHYALVTVNGWFAENVLQKQFRRHYAQMSLLARFEHAMLLGFSSDIAEAADKLGAKNDRGADDGFTNRIVALHRHFLLFVNRFRFTGVSSQIQGIEMFDLWRNSLGLAALHSDVRAELEATSAYVQTQAEKRRADAAEGLNKIAFAIAVIALVTGVMATPLYDRWVQRDLDCAGTGCAWANTGLMREIEALLVLGAICLAGWLFWLGVRGRR